MVGGRGGGGIAGETVERGVDEGRGTGNEEDEDDGRDWLGESGTGDGAVK